MVENDFQALKRRFVMGELEKADFIAQALVFHRSLFDYMGIIRSTDVHEISITPEGVSFLIGDENIRLFAPMNEARVAPIEIMNFGQYEPAETRFMDLLATGAGTILDIGANIGWHTVRMAKRHPQAHVHAFEPMPVSYRFLERNIAVNGVEQRVSCHNCGLAQQSGSFEFFAPSAGGVNASLRNVSQSSDAAVVIGVVLTLDQWLTSQNNIALDFIKCDVEGAELPVFLGGKETLRQHRPAVFSELLRKWSRPFGYHPNDLLAFFRELGYRCYAVGAVGARHITAVTDDTPETNYIFLHEEKHDAIIRQLDALK